MYLGLVIWGTGDLTNTSYINRHWFLRLLKALIASLPYYRKLPSTAEEARLNYQFRTILAKLGTLTDQYAVIATLAFFPPQHIFDRLVVT